MVYPIPPEWTTDGRSTAWNDTLFDSDKHFAALWYPRPDVVRGQLRTGDDCDAIDFVIQPGAAAGVELYRRKLAAISS